MCWIALPLFRRVSSQWTGTRFSRNFLLANDAKLDKSRFPNPPTPNHFHRVTRWHRVTWFRDVYCWPDAGGSFLTNFSLNRSIGICDLPSQKPSLVNSIRSVSESSPINARSSGDHLDSMVT